MRHCRNYARVDSVFVIGLLEFVVGPEKSWCSRMSRWRSGVAVVTSESAHSPPMRAPFSATERFISSTTGTSASITTAISQKQSK